MANLSEQEALALVAVRGHCDELDRWKRTSARLETWEIKSGLIDDLGIRHDQSIQLRVTQATARSYSVSFLFTLFLNTKFGQERIYQLEVHLGKRKPNCWHRRSHEHIGSTRHEEREEWATWDYAQSLAHFCRRTNIFLIPIPPNPLLSDKEKGNANRHH